jgi:2-keto-4-pentenoate hydratase/2-oxohepta-3-ene-1,7-dioic acid hydratase in catechol pathway
LAIERRRAAAERIQEHLGRPSGSDPPRWLGPGDVVEIEIDGIGLLRSPIVDEG